MAASKNSLISQPLNPITIVTDLAIEVIPAESISQDLVGEKAFGLSCLPQFWTLPFIVISFELLSKYKSSTENDRDSIVNNWAQKIVIAALGAGITAQDQIIVRSSGCAEGMDERGKFYSVNGFLNNISQSLVQCLQKLATDIDSNDHKIPLVLQKYVTISAKGHLSNERRVYEEKRDWLGQFEEPIINSGNSYFKIPLRNWRKKINIDTFTDLPLACNLLPQISETLKIPATWGSKQGLRLHIEWVWDGSSIFLVQADNEHVPSGVNPNKINKTKLSISSEFTPKCIKEINNLHASKYNKIRNVFTYIKLGLPRTKLYVIDSQTVIDDLADDKFPIELIEDLSEMVKGSLVIRMDIATDDIKRRQLLPRTHEVRELGQALDWLKQQCKTIKKHALQDDDVVFILHNFVPAHSSAFAFAAPGERKVQIEALWGLPEGLYYNSHDKYIVDTQSYRGKTLNRDNFGQYTIHKKRFFKQFFVSPDEDGRWTTKTLIPPFDWNETIHNQEWIKEIALQSRRIADEEGKPLSIMWFVGVPAEVCSTPVFPWYHEAYNPKIFNRAKAHRTKTPFDKSLVIRTSANIEELRKESEKGHSNVRLVRIQPSEEKLLRDKDTLRTIGELTKKIDAVILLEGGVLSHAYYQLLETGAIVEVKHPFEEFDEKQEFNKLVRDKVPSNIELGGELVSKARLSGEYLLRALREKLVEEAFEVLDATDQDSIVGELADVSEVIDSILSQFNVSREDLRYRQDKKREKAGGFNDGVVLLETRNPLPTNKNNDDSDTLFDDVDISYKRDSLPLDSREVIELGHQIEKWSDRREHQAATETILNLIVPMVRDIWVEKSLETIVDPETGTVVQAKVTGRRQNAKTQIEISIYTQQKQLNLFK